MEAKPFEILTNGGHFVKNHLKSTQKHPDFESSGFSLVGTIAKPIAKAQPFEIRPYKCLEFECFQISNGPISVPTVYLSDVNDKNPLLNN